MVALHQAVGWDLIQQSLGDNSDGRRFMDRVSAHIAEPEGLHEQLCCKRATSVGTSPQQFSSDHALCGSAVFQAGEDVPSCPSVVLYAKPSDDVH